jgi:hypothetical protein
MVMTTVQVMEQDYKGETMKQLILILTIFLIGEVFAQPTSPSGYTTNYRFRLWTQGANPSADSLNANWTLADTKIKLAYDSASVKMNTYGNQNSRGLKTFTGGGIALGGGRLFFNNSTVTTPLFIGELCPTTSRYYLTYTSPTGTDTLATLANIRSGAGGYAMLTGATFTGDVSVGQDLRTPYDSVQVASTSISADNKSFLHLYTPAAPQDLETINGGSDGKILYITNTDATYSITVKDNAGNINTAGDFVMSQYDTMTLIYNSVASKWLELSRSNN